MEKTSFEVIIVGGSYAGLSAALALGRSLRQVLIIDSGKPCNRQTPHSHNFLTQDGEKPSIIANKAKQQLVKYEHVSLLHDLVVDGRKTQTGFQLSTDGGKILYARKLLFATGIHDTFPDIPGFDRCWGISVLHCPYCHGYEVRNEPLGVLANGDMGFEFAKLISNWSNNLTVFTNGKAGFSELQRNKLGEHQVEVVEKEIERFDHNEGQIHQVIFKDKSQQTVSALFAKINFNQHCEVMEKMGCELTEGGYVRVDEFGKTSEPGIYAAGDCAGNQRAVSAAVASGTRVGGMLNKELIDETF